MTANVARDDQSSKQQCDVVVKREKSKTHEAQTTSSIGRRYSNSRARAGAACTAAYDDQNLLGVTDESRDKDNASPTHVLADAQAHGGEQLANTAISAITISKSTVLDSRLSECLDM